MDHLQLLDLVRHPLSPDTRLEVPASREEFELVQEILDTEDTKYPQIWYDSLRNLAIIVAPPTPLHSGMAGALLTRISSQIRNSGISSDVTDNLTQDADRRTTKNTGRGLTTRAGDGALRYWEGKRATLMIAVEVGVSQSYVSLRQAISWSVVILGCRLGLAMSIHEESRGTPHTRYYASLEQANAVLEEAEDDLYQQLTQHQYGPLEWDGETWFGKIRRVALETYRPQDEDCPLDTLLEPSQSFMIVQDGEYIRHDISPNLREVVVGDCIPSHLLTGRHFQATPLNFFQREWFEDQFQGLMVETALLRLQEKIKVRQPIA
ncbi:hypothetical protein V1520DRAFT_366175 [Lipomyces starkeyi]|uniref:Uncharacterized protein n=1 Tax=Lipomyces starkeyi NRRL Y-11557 TaxID=675824 RepID=A0A1E3PVM5_LIPST|nr:hypothetical protein LIPSTDRAFT_6668 [Lipomyces starkeyi NRRL Y-11557]